MIPIKQLLENEEKDTKHSAVTWASSYLVTSVTNNHISLYLKLL